jgi:hypothetical protein
LLLVPVLLGVFAGAPLLARELESGTFRFAWTQGCGRLRWALAELALPAIALTAATGAFTALFSWYMRPFTAYGLTKSAIQPTEFPLHGVAFAAWTLAAFAIAAFAGVTIRRTAHDAGPPVQLLGAEQLDYRPRRQAGKPGGRQ